jgi:iron(III) transport system permease protein
MALLLLGCLGVPAFGAVSASLVSGLGTLMGGAAFTFDNYRRALTSPELYRPLLYSGLLAVITATVTVLLGLVVARLLTSRRGRSSARMLDLLLLAAVALPGIVFAAGYIFTYNLPLTNDLGIHLYETTPLLVLGYIATALPPASRVLFGSVGQVQESLREASRVHGSTNAGSWLRVMLPLLARPLLSAWSLTLGATLLELPVSQLLYPPDDPTVSVGIEKALSNYDYGGGTAMEVLAVRGRRGRRRVPRPRLRPRHRLRGRHADLGLRAARKNPRQRGAAAAGPGRLHRLPLYRRRRDPL